MAGYAIIRVEKHSTLGTIAGIGHHLDRTRETPNADPERAHLNRTWNGSQWVAWGDEPRKSGAHLHAFKQRLEDFQQRGGKIQANAVIALEVLLSASPEAFREPGFRLDDWVDAQAEYVAKRFGQRNVVSLVLHLDEETPHVHALVIPEIERVERRGNKKTTKPQEPKPPKPALAASQWVGSRALLRDLQTDYGAAMARFGLQRGKERSGAKHVPVSVYYARGEALVREAEHLRSEVARLRPAAERLPQVERQLAELPDLRRKAARLARHEADIRAMDILREHAPESHQYVLDRAELVLQAAIDRDVERLQADGGGVAAAPGFDLSAGG